jgi:acyl-CoA oxidase
VQEKLFRIMANTQAILMMCFRISQLLDEKKMTIGQVAMGKAFCTERAREVVKLGRELFGGNGITHDNYVMKALADLEGVYTYEGTYDINVLVTGRELTGIPAFK